MNQLLAHPAFIYAGIALAALLSLILLMYGRKVQKTRADWNKHHHERTKLAAKSYEDLDKDYRAAKEKLSGPAHRVEVIDIIHDLSDNNFGRDNLEQYISFDLAFAIAEQIRAAKNKDILIVLHTLGGYSFASEMIAEALKAHKRKTRVIVPYVAMSGGTMVALAADEVWMGKGAALGPIDAQFGPFPADAYAQLVQEKSKEHINDIVLLTSYVVKKHENTARDRAFKILNKHHQKDEKKPRAVTDALLNGEMHHGEKIAFDTAKKIGMNVIQECPKEAYAVVDLRLRMLGKAETEQEAVVVGLLPASAIPAANAQAK
jgi:ClpP class serine protease